MWASDWKQAPDAGLLEQDRQEGSPLRVASGLRAPRRKDKGEAGTMKRSNASTTHYVRTPGLRLMLVIVALATAAPLQAQEAGAYATVVARDVDGMRGLKGGGAYVAMAALPFLDLRLDLGVAGRSRLSGSATWCSGDGAGPCVEEAIERESRLTTVELGMVGWTRPLPGVRFGAGVGAARHSVSLSEHGTQTGRRQRLLDGRNAWGPSIALHSRVSPSFSPGALVFVSVSRSFVTHDGCGADGGGICGSSGSFTLRAGVGYTFGGARQP
jgi:hypothetical protein